MVQPNREIRGEASGKTQITTGSHLYNSNAGGSETLPYIKTSLIWEIPLRKIKTRMIHAQVALIMHQSAEMNGGRVGYCRCDRQLCRRQLRLIPPHAAETRDGSAALARGMPPPRYYAREPPRFAAKFAISEQSNLTCLGTPYPP